MKTVMTFILCVFTSMSFAGPGGGAGGMGGGIIYRMSPTSFSEAPSIQIPLHLLVSAQDTQGQIHGVARLVEQYQVKDHKLHIDLANTNFLDIELVNDEILDLNDDVESLIERLRLQK